MESKGIIVLFSEYLIEKLIIDDIIHQKIERAIRLWVEWIRSELPDEPYQYKVTWVESHSKQICEKLRRHLAPIVQQIVKQNIIDIPDPNYEGHKIKVEIDLERFRVNHGSIQQRWSKLYTKRPKYIYANYFSIHLLPPEVVLFTDNIDRTHDLISTIVHELTHVIQSLRSPKQSTWTKPFHAAHKKYTSDEWYYMSKIELNAYAQGTASRIIFKSKQFDDPKLFIGNNINMLKYGMVNMFSREVVPNQQYQEIRDTLKQQSNDPTVNLAKKRAWKYYNKKIIEKLLHYLETNK